MLVESRLEVPFQGLGGLGIGDVAVQVGQDRVGPALVHQCDGLVVVLLQAVGDRIDVLDVGQVGVKVRPDARAGIDHVAVQPGAPRAGTRGVHLHELVREIAAGVDRRVDELVLQLAQHHAGRDFLGAVGVGVEFLEVIGAGNQ